MAIFQIYKPQQGRYVRLGTAIGSGLIVALGLVWLNGYLSDYPVYVSGGITLAAAIIGAYAVFYVCNRPSFVDFFDKTESEMRKVTWPSREQVIKSTQVVIAITLAIAFLLFIVDTGFIKLFNAIGLFGS